VKSWALALIILAFAGDTLKEWNVIHKIKMLYDNGQGLSIRAITKETGLARNTIRKYLRMDESEISQKLADPQRYKQLDEYRIFIEKQLCQYPLLTAKRISAKLSAHFPELDVSERTVRRYVNTVRKEVCEKLPRYYEPIIDMIPGQQCQVDPGELRNVIIDGVPTTVYFVVFVLSYSRLMHVSASFKPIDTTIFIRMHDA
jgi:transposase